MATIIYIADDAQTRKFKGECRGIAGLKIGAFHGLGESDTYFVELGKSIRNSAGSIDAVVFDETSIASVVGANTLMSALIHYIKTGVASSVKLVVIDPEHVINNKGRSVLNQHGIRIIADIGELGPQFRQAFDERNRTDSEKGFTYDANYTRYDANGMEDNPDDDYDDVESPQTALADATDGQAGDDDMRIISKHTTNPFDDIENAIGEDDPFSGFDDAFGGSDDATEFSDHSDMSDVDGDAFDDEFDDDFRIIGATYSDGGEAFSDDEQTVAGDDPFAGLYGTDDGNQGGATGGVDSIFDDLEQEPVGDVGLSTNLNGYSGDFDSRDIKRLLSFKEPSWDYSAINEALRNEGSGLFRGRKSGQKLGEVAPSSLANSVYIEEKQMREGAYSAPDETKIISLFSPAGGVGKAVCLGQPVPSMDMDNGTIVMKQARDIAIGDCLIGRNGEATRVLGVYPQGELDSYRVNFKDGTSVVCSGNHIWTVRKGRSDKDIDITTEEMLHDFAMNSDAFDGAFKVPIVNPVKLPEKELHISPYSLGTAIRDGQHSEQDEQPLVSPNIPDEYLNASIEQRCQLLAGLMDADGTPTDSFTTTSTVLKNQFLYLVRSLGYRASVNETCSGENGTNVIYAIHIWANDAASYYQNSTSSNVAQADEYLSITSIEKLGYKEEMVCFYVDAPDHLFCVGDFILTHNTTIATMIGIQLNWYFNHDVMSGRTTSLTTRVLVLSLNEFDDIATKGIGYDSPIGQDDNKNVAELKKRIEECNGNPEWDDISQCFTASASNYVFYLPSLTLKEKLHDEIEITAEDYKMIIEVCSRFFGFIVLDMPDVMYDQKNGLVEFGLNNSDVVGVVIEPDTKNTVLLYYMLDGMKDNNNIINWDPDKSILIINKYATPDNPYLGYVKDPSSYGQIKYESIVKAAANDFCYAQAMPLTEYRVTGNVLFTSDPEIKIAARDLTDKVLDVIDTNDEKNKKFVHKINQF